MQVWNGTVVQIRRPRPYTIQRDVGISVGLSVGVKYKRRRVDRMEPIDQPLSKRIQAMTVRLDSRNIRHLSCVRAAKGMATRAVLSKDRAPALCRCLVDSE